VHIMCIMIGIMEFDGYCKIVMYMYFCVADDNQL